MPSILWYWGKKAEGEISSKRSACTPQRVRKQPSSSPNISSPGTHRQQERAGSLDAGAGRWGSQPLPAYRSPVGGPPVSCPRAEGVLELATTGSEKLIVHISSPFYIQGCLVGSLKLAVVGVSLHRYRWASMTVRASLPTPHNVKHSPAALTWCVWPGLQRTQPGLWWGRKWAGLAVSRPQFLSQL